MADRCGLCYGDGWITDQIGNLTALRSQDEEYRFMERMNETGRMACPRCQPNWKPNATDRGANDV